MWWVSSKVIRKRCTVICYALIKRTSKISNTVAKNVKKVQKMVQLHSVQGYENFFKYMEDLKVTEPIFVLYTGTKLSNGQSWCSDCVEAKPIIEEGFKSAPANVHLIEVEVGDRVYWKDLNCPFRKDSTTKLKVLPTLTRWGTQKRLEGDQLLKMNLIELLLTDEDD